MALGDQTQRLADLLLFARVAECGSFTAAARALGTSKSSASKQVQRLERGLGATLLHRTTRRLSLTEAGRGLLDHAQAMVRSAAAAAQVVAAHHGQPAGRLRLTASVTYGRHVLAPLLPDFHAAYPAVEVELLLVDRHVDLWEEGLDLAIRLTGAPPPALAGRPLHTCPFVLCATPAFLERHPLQAPGDLAQRPCLAFRSGGGPGGDTWRLRQGGRQQDVRVHGPVRVNSSDVVRDLVLAGMGIGLLPRFVVEADLQAGRLQQALPDWTPDGAFGPQAWALWQPQRHMAPKLRVAVDFLVARLADPAEP